VKTGAGRTLLQVVGAYELVVGGFGVLWLCLQVLRSGGASLYGLVFLALYALVAGAGYSLVKGRAGGVRLSLVAQAVQVIQVTSTSLSWLFLAGVAWWLEIGGRGVHLSGLDLGTRFHLAISSGFGPSRTALPFSIGINLVPALILACLACSRPGGRKKR
jgi:hypothetical protein